MEEENSILLEEKIALSDAFNNNKFELKDKDSKLFEATEKLKMKELERVKMSHRIEGCEAKIKENERNKELVEKSQLALADEISQANKRIFHLEEKKKSNERDLLDLRKRLLKAKIEVVQEIRNNISE